MGIGKSSVREAIKMLQAIGVVEVRRGQGTLIRREPGEPLVDPMAFGMILARGVTRDVLEFRRMFEPAYTIQAMENATDDDLKAIQSTITDMENAIVKGEQTARHDAAFHRAILHATHNPMTIRVGETLLQLIEAALETAVQTLPESGLENHKRIFAAFLSGDKQKVIDAINFSSKTWETDLAYNESKSELMFGASARGQMS